MAVESVGRDNKPSGAAGVFLQSVCIVECVQYGEGRVLHVVPRPVMYGTAWQTCNVREMKGWNRVMRLCVFRFSWHGWLQRSASAAYIGAGDRG